MSGWNYAPLGATGVIEAQDEARTETGHGDELDERAELLAHRQDRRRARIKRPEDARPTRDARSSP